ncbi:MAG: winged helix-turn-helix domain-containing protein [Thermofilum sp.]|nr:winged helix-turn-helix domain-containing protein [Thermofilum sp.]MCC6064947.1 winged helix-turn-helix domain-containing protein [Thermofilum sp.]
MPSKILSVREALSNPIRRRIVLILMENPGISIRQLARELGVGAGTLSGHLLILQRLGLVREERNGRRVLLYLNQSFLRGTRAAGAGFDSPGAT